MTDLKVFLLGTPRIEFEGKPVPIERRKALALIAYLAMEGHPQSRDVVATLLWPNLNRTRAHATLRSTLPTLTHAVPVEWLEADRTSLALKPSTTWIDARAFLTLLARSRSHGHGSDTLCPDCVDLFEQAIDCYQGDFLTGFGLPDSTDFDHWQLTQREWLRRELAGILRRLAHYHAKLEQFDLAIIHARHWLSLDQLHEPAHRLLMRLYVATGQRSEALRQYQQCVELLDSELATPPEEETSRLYEVIQGSQSSGSQTGEFTATVSTSILPPLPALVIGRQEALQQIKHRLGVGDGEMRSITVIQDWPGVGKSTTVAMLAHDAEIARQFSDGVLWASLGEAPNLQAGISAWANVMNLPAACSGVSWSLYPLPAPQAAGYVPVEESRCSSAALSGFSISPASFNACSWIWRATKSLPNIPTPGGYPSNYQRAAPFSFLRMRQIACAL